MPKIRVVKLLIFTILISLLSFWMFAESMVNYAAERDFTGMVRLCLTVFPYLANRTDEENGNSPLMIASSRGDIEMVRFILRKGISPNSRGLGGDTPLLRAASRNNYEIIKLLVDAGADVNAAEDDDDDDDTIILENDTSLTLLAECQESRSYKAISFLLAKGADVNAATNLGITPLHNAVGALSKDVVKLLLDNGANVNARTKQGWKPFHRGWTPLHSIASNEFYDCDLPGSETGETICAAKSIIDMLLAKGADINAKDIDGKTLLRLLCEKEKDKHISIIEYLKEKGARDIIIE